MKRVKNKETLTPDVHETARHQNLEKNNYYATAAQKTHCNDNHTTAVRESCPMR